MSSAATGSNIVATRYIRALIDLAQDAKSLDKVEQDFTDLSAMIAGSEDLRRMIASPLIAKNEQIAVVDALSAKAKFQKITTNFLKVLIENRRLNILADAVGAFAQELSVRRGEVIVTVETAQDLSAKQLKALEGAMKKQMGADVSIEAKVSPEILGGMIVTAGSKMVDDSVRRKLDRLRVAMGAQEAA